MQKDTVLIVDDERNIRNLLRMYLEQDGYAVVDIDASSAVFQYLDGHPTPQLIILDVMLPGMDGFQVCSKMKAGAYPDIPILMLTARDEDVDKIVGLEIGADDYVTKPFNPREVVARVKAILRRSKGTATSDRSETINVGDVVIDVKRRSITIGHQPVTFRRKEFDLLTVLAQEKDIVHTRDQLLERVWGYDYFGETRTVDVHIASIRHKLEGSAVHIETVTGIGYKLTI
jgi:two-component system alkaline phosphatase synthesis response regulator PhoP